MSKGPGRIERAIQAIFANEPDNAFTIYELVERVYSDIEFPTYGNITYFNRKYLVAVRRAVNNMRKRGSAVDTFVTWSRGHSLVVYNRFSVMSYGLACVMNPGHYYTKEELLKRLAEGGDHHDDVIEGGRWWIQTQWAIEEHAAKQAGDEERLQRLKAEQERQRAEWREKSTEWRTLIQALNRNQDD
jgi:hypothetical protein